jgi:hypothetical protein
MTLLEEREKLLNRGLEAANTALLEAQRVFALAPDALAA